MNTQVIPWLLFFFPIVVGFIIGAFADRSTPYGKCPGSNQPNPPPSIAFPIAWTILYLLMGGSLVLIWNTQKRWSWELTTFIILTLILDFWYLIFTRTCSPYALSWTLIALIILFILQAVAFGRINPIASYLLIPLILWLIYATYLSYPRS